jgi:hypothetical protein
MKEYWLSRRGFVVVLVLGLSAFVALLVLFYWLTRHPARVY